MATRRATPEEIKAAGIGQGGTVTEGPVGKETSNLMRVTVQIGERRFDEDLAAQAFIAPNVEALNEALSTNPSRYAEWAMVEALARAELDKVIGNTAVLDADLKELEARIYLEILEGPTAKPTVDAIKAKVIIDPRRLALVKLQQELDAVRIGAKGNLDKIAVGRKTMEEKRDSLLELARNWRQEMQGKLTVNTQQFKPGGRGK